MPLVRDYVVTQTDTVKTKRNRPHNHLVHPDNLKEGMLVVKPTHNQLATFGEEEFNGEGRSFSDLIHQPGLISQAPGGGFIDMDWRDACARVKELGDVVRDSQVDDEVEDAGNKLAELLALEAENRPPRKSVIKAFISAGLGEAADFGN